MSGGWVDVTEACEVALQNGLMHGYIQLNMPITQTPQSLYRLRKVPICTGTGPSHEPTKQWAFIVEKRKETP